MQDGWKAVWSILYVSVAFFPSLKQNFIAYCYSKVSSCPDCIFEIHQLWQSGFSRVYSNCCCSCSFEREIIKIGQSSHKMYSNNILNFQESKTNLNACTKKSGNLSNAPHTHTHIYIYIYIYWKYNFQFHENKILTPLYWKEKQKLIIIFYCKMEVSLQWSSSVFIYSKFMFKKQRINFFSAIAQLILMVIDFKPGITSCEFFLPLSIAPPSHIYILSRIITVLLMIFISFFGLICSYLHSW